MTDNISHPPKRRQPLRLLYISFVLAGIILLSDTYHIAHLERWTVKLGIAMIYSAVSLIVGHGRTLGYVAAIILWIAVVASFFV
ncbi:MAG: hypothetical protein AB1744_06625 [Candidatus Zixiibacteriota bacterium]